MLPLPSRFFLHANMLTRFVQSVSEEEVRHATRTCCWFWWFVNTGAWPKCLI